MSDDPTNPTDPDPSDDAKCYRVRLPSVNEARRIVGLEPLTEDQAQRAGYDSGYLERVPEDQSVFLCGTLGPKCVTCGDVADAACDFPIGAEARTCDRAICARCSPEVGADKNYCIPHAEHGPGMVLFVRPESPEVVMKPRHRPRIPKAPAEGRRHRVVREYTGVSGGTFWEIMTAWMDELTARRAMTTTAMRVQSWDDFVAWHRATWPLKQRKPRRKT